MSTDAIRRPWYREPWPWILMAGPALVIAAGAVTVWLAMTSWDGLVVDDYYKQGLEINRALARGERAAALHYEAELTLDPLAGVVRVRPGARLLADAPQRLRLAAAHATRGGRDQRIELSRAADGTYDGRIAPLAPGRWQIVLEDAGLQWRIRGEIHAPDGRGAHLTP